MIKRISLLLLCSVFLLGSCLTENNYNEVSTQNIVNNNQLYGKKNTKKKVKKKAASKKKAAKKKVKKKAKKKVYKRVVKRKVSKKKKKKKTTYRPVSTTTTNSYVSTPTTTWNPPTTTVWNPPTTTTTTTTTKPPLKQFTIGTIEGVGDSYNYRGYSTCRLDSLDISFETSEYSNKVEAMFTAYMTKISNPSSTIDYCYAVINFYDEEGTNIGSDVISISGLKVGEKGIEEDFTYLVNADNIVGNTISAKVIARA